MSAYHAFLAALTQLEQDQSLFEGLVGNELIGVHHENLVRMGGKMAHKLRHFANLGESFAATVSPGLVPRFTDAVQEYSTLLMPPKVFGGLCPCFKAARDGPEYDRKFMSAMAKVATVVFLSQAVVIESKSEKYNMDSMHFADYANRLNTVHTTLAAIQSKGGGDKVREGARQELLAATEAVKRFMNAFEEDTADFRQEYVRRVGQIVELLNAPSPDGGAISRRLLVKAQSGLQEVMNSAAMLSYRKAGSALADTEALAKELKAANDALLSVLNEVGPRMAEFGLGDVAMSLRNEADTLHTDASSKLRDSAKRWGTVRAQSQPRPVVEFVDDPVAPLPDQGIIQLSNLGGPGGLNLHGSSSGADLDPEKLLRDTGKKIGDIGKKGAQAAQKAVNNVEKFGQKLTALLPGELTGKPAQQPYHPQQPQQQQYQQQQQQYQQPPPQAQQYQYQQVPQQQLPPQPPQQQKSSNPLAGLFS